MYRWPAGVQPHESGVIYYASLIMRARCLFLLLIAVSVLSPLLLAEEWSRFRGPNGSGISSDTGFPVRFSRDRNAVWRTPVRPGKSSPVLTGRHIFVTAFDDRKLFTQCFDRTTGKLLWERAEERPRAEVGNVRNEPASISPVTDGENVYIFFQDLGLISYDASGKLRWKTRLGPFTNTMRLAASPILSEDAVIIVVDQNDDS